MKNKFYDEILSLLYSSSDIPSNILNETIKRWVAINPGKHVGYFFAFNQVENKFIPSRIYPIELEERVSKSIQPILQGNDLTDFKNEFSNKCGLFWWVGHEYLKNNIKNYIVFKTNERHAIDEYNRYHYKVQYYNDDTEVEYIFPVFSRHLNQKEILFAIVVLASCDLNYILNEIDLKQISHLLSLGVSWEENNAAEIAINKFVNSLSGFIEFASFSSAYLTIFDALHVLFEENALNSCKIKHIAFWTNNEVKNGSSFLVKEKQINYVSKDAINNVRTTVITRERKTPEGLPHFFYQNIKKWSSIIKNCNEPLNFKELISITKMIKISSQFFEYDTFIRNNGISDNDILVVFPILSPSLISSRNNENKIFGMLSIYFDGRTNPYFYRPELIEVASYQIYASCRKTIQSLRRALREKIIECSSYLLSDESRFMNKACDSIRELVNCRDCLIYLFNESKSEINLKYFSGNYKSPLKIKLEDKGQLNKSGDQINNQTFWTKLSIFASGEDLSNKEALFWNHEIFYQDQNSDNLKIIIPDIRNDIWSAMVLPIEGINNHTIGFLICFNNMRKITSDDKYEKSYFSNKDYEIVSIACQTIGLFWDWLSSSKSSEIVFKKLAHEIPSQSNLIRQNIDEIKDLFIREIRPNFENQSMLRHLENLINQTKYSSLMLTLYGEYSRLKTINKETLGKVVERINLRIYMNSLIDVFRTFAYAFGVFIEFHLTILEQTEPIIWGHPLLSFSFVNVINNAIQYSLFGTNILVKYNTDST